MREVVCLTRQANFLVQPSLPPLWGPFSRDLARPCTALSSSFDIPGKLQAEKATFGDPETRLPLTVQWESRSLYTS